MKQKLTNTLQTVKQKTKPFFHKVFSYTMQRY